MKMPRMRPQDAPTTMEGIKIPAGILIPKVAIVRMILSVAVKRREAAFDHIDSGLQLGVSSRANIKTSQKNSLAETVKVCFNLFTLFKKIGDDEGRVCSCKMKRVAENGSYQGDDAYFIQRPLAQPRVFPEGSIAEIQLDEHCSVETAKDSQENEKRKLKNVPVPLVLDLEEDELTCPEWIH